MVSNSQEGRKSAPRFIGVISKKLHQATNSMTSNPTGYSISTDGLFFIENYAIRIKVHLTDIFKISTIDL